jgi:ribosomal protein S18
MADKKVRYLNPIDIETKAERYCRFRKKGIKYIDYKDPDFLLMLCNPQGKILPRRLTGTSLKVPAQGVAGHQEGPPPRIHAIRGG